MRLLRGESLDPRQFEHIQNHPADIAVADGGSWLRMCCPDFTGSVTLSWDSDTALHTSWELFTARWDDFCYPASDDVFILPDSRGWVLLYHHAEGFSFGIHHG
jgi:hypothetical protein